MAATPLIAFRLEERDNNRLRATAAAHQKTISDLIREAVIRELDRLEANPS